MSSTFVSYRQSPRWLPPQNTRSARIHECFPNYSQLGGPSTHIFIFYFSSLPTYTIGIRLLFTFLLVKKHSNLLDNPILLTEWWDKDSGEEIHSEFLFPCNLGSHAYLSLFPVLFLLLQNKPKFATQLFLFAYLFPILLDQEKNVLIQSI